MSITGLAVKLSPNFELSLMFDRLVFAWRLVIEIGLVISTGALKLPSGHYLIIGKLYFLALAAHFLVVVVGQVGRLALQSTSCHF